MSVCEAPEATISKGAQLTSGPDSWVAQHGDYLFNFAFGQLRDAAAAEDAVQDSLLAAWQARDRFAGASSERTWLTSILRHKIYDRLRRTSRARVKSLYANDRDENDSLSWVHEVAAECLPPHRRLELEEFKAALTHALGTLPPRLAQAFQLYEIEERSNGDVCRHMNISESNLWVMVHRARKQLREKLAGWWKGEKDFALPR